VVIIRRSKQGSRTALPAEGRPAEERTGGRGGGERAHGRRRRRRGGGGPPHPSRRRPAVPAVRREAVPVQPRPELLVAHDRMALAGPLRQAPILIDDSRTPAR